MIGWLSGVVRSLRGERITLDVGGVGYEIFMPAPSLPPNGSRAEIFIHTHVREDAIALYGFATPGERELFEYLLGVTGVGAKTALAILSSLPADALIAAIQRKDTGLLQRTPGIGRKTAERLVLELHDKLRGFEGGAPAARLRPGSPEEEVVSALLNLGYRRSEAESAVARVEPAKFDSFDRMFKETLKVLAR